MIIIIIIIKSMVIEVTTFKVLFYHFGMGITILISSEMIIIFYILPIYLMYISFFLLFVVFWFCFCYFWYYMFFLGDNINLALVIIINFYVFYHSSYYSQPRLLRAKIKICSLFWIKRLNLQSILLCFWIKKNKTCI